MGIDELEETVDASGSSGDLETLFQLIYLGFTSPRKDAAVFDATKARLRAMLVNRRKDPRAVFADRLQQELYGHHARRQPLTVQALDRVGLGEAMSFYRDRFADASDFTFVIVGNVSVKAIEPLVARYLGGLPAAGRKESFADRGVRFTKLPRRFEVRLGQEQARVHIQYVGRRGWSREEEYKLRALSRVLGIRLRERLREDMSGTYSVRTRASFARRPIEHYQLTIAFDCAPENVDRMISAVFAEVEGFKRQGVSAADVHKVKSGHKRGYETSLRDNDFWRRELARHYRYGTDPKLILLYHMLVDTLAPDVIKDAANTYLVSSRRLVGILRPAPVGSR